MNILVFSPRLGLRPRARKNRSPTPGSPSALSGPRIPIFSRKPLYKNNNNRLRIWIGFGGLIIGWFFEKKYKFWIIGQKRIFGKKRIFGIIGKIGCFLKKIKFWIIGQKRIFKNENEYLSKNLQFITSDGISR